MIKKSIKINQKGNNIDVTCTKCGEPITHSNEWGMFCEKECNLEESKKAFDKINKMFGGMFK